MSPTPTVAHLLHRNADTWPDRPALSWREPGSADWRTLTWSGVRDRVAGLAEGYAALGVAPGDHVLLMMGNRPEHWLSDLALVRAGAVTTTVYSTSAPDQVRYIARHCRARLAVVGDAGSARAWERLVADPDTPLERLVVVDGADPERGHVPYTDLAAVAAPASSAAEDRSDPDDRLTVVYTSGTTGEPKGVVLTHRHVFGNATALDRVVELPDHAEHICYLPLAHIAERMLGLYLPLFRASHVWLCADPQELPEVLRHVRPPQFFGVPRVWEKLASALRAGLDRLPPDRRAAVDRARALAAEHISRRERGELVPDDLAERAERARAQVLAPLLAAAGLDRVVWAASASAPMPPEVVRFWAGMGLAVMDAWGLTETTGVATVNSPVSGFRLGSVGRPIDGVELRVAGDGEILVRGATVFEGYLNPDGSVGPGTGAGGWFATGDVGRRDEDGFVWITDRKKELIVTSHGKNVAPSPVENALKEHPLIGQAYVHGDGRPHLVALLVLDPETAPAWAAAHGIRTGAGTGDGRPLAEHPAVLAEAGRAVAAANARLSRPEQVKRHRLLDREWGPGTGELTPSLKLRRRVVRDLYRDELAALYEP
ncbi:long-chain fatty acid--CoA ligase [Nocardiopsis sp. NRRL B-16309]|uniref:AMP-dependent synthetase/ligase n=1 Tax=Nocardiopsis sp. NRRL B-16309 TaxID=1519494 RepID=UPI0006ADFE1F|nr:AMP-dependent synthetase/ligase [Nocardiopsis sp. NRRL B-16309]KOX23843.1 AMP-dependent synthetase [Nocardiopsis sp. NRRL B-16309]